MLADDRPDAEFDAMTARLLRREALRRAAEEINTTSGPGLESVLAKISAEVTAEAAANKTSPAPRAGEVLPRA
jgi:phage shock protein A